MLKEENWCCHIFQIVSKLISQDFWRQFICLKSLLPRKWWDICQLSTDLKFWTKYKIEKKYFAKGTHYANFFNRPKKFVSNSRTENILLRVELNKRLLKLSLMVCLCVISKVPALTRAILEKTNGIIQNFSSSQVVLFSILPKIT